MGADTIRLANRVVSAVAQGRPVRRCPGAPARVPPLVGQQLVEVWGTSHDAAPLAGAAVVSRRHIDSLAGRSGVAPLIARMLQKCEHCIDVLHHCKVWRGSSVDTKWPMPFWIKEGLPLRNAFPPTHPGIRTVPRWWGGPGPTPHSSHVGSFNRTVELAPSVGR